MSEIKPLPCPFCGARDIHLSHADGWPYYECHECGGGGPCYSDQESTALRLWNARPAGDVEVGGWLKEELECAEEDARESHKAAMNSYGAGYDAGYVAALKACADAVNRSSPAETKL